MSDYIPGGCILPTADLQFSIFGFYPELEENDPSSSEDEEVAVLQYQRPERVASNPEVDTAAQSSGERTLSVDTESTQASNLATERPLRDGSFYRPLWIAERTVDLDGFTGDEWDVIMPEPLWAPDPSTWGLPTFSDDEEDSLDSSPKADGGNGVSIEELQFQAWTEGEQAAKLVEILSEASKVPSKDRDEYLATRVPELLSTA